MKKDDTASLIAGLRPEQIDMAVHYEEVQNIHPDIIAFCDKMESRITF